jgi:hypothetical protein
MSFDYLVYYREPLWVESFQDVKAQLLEGVQEHRFVRPTSGEFFAVKDDAQVFVPSGFASPDR